MPHRSLALCWAVIALTLFSPKLFAQQLHPPVQAVITEAGTIEYFTVTPPDPATDSELRESFEDAVKTNLGMKDYMTKHPETEVLVGSGKTYYGMKGDQIQTAGYEAQPAFTYAGAQPAGFLEQVFGNKLDKGVFLASLASDLLEQVKTLSCGVGVVPETVEGSVNLGIISFTATWDTQKLCK